MLGAYAWTDPSLFAGQTALRAVHITELRKALHQAYGATGSTPPVCTDAVLTPGQTVMKAVHIIELRSCARARYCPGGVPTESAKGSSVGPAANKDIADALWISEETVETHVGYVAGPHHTQEEQACVAILCEDGPLPRGC